MWAELLRGRTHDHARVLSPDALQERLDLDALEELARLLGAELLHEDTPARTLVRRVDDTYP